MVKALITGGTGFIGSHIARLLVADGHQVRILHRPNSKLTALEGVSFESALGGLREADMPALIRACEGCDWVFHVAAVQIIGVPIKQRCLRSMWLAHGAS